MNKEQTLILWEQLGMETTCGDCPHRNHEECDGFHEGKEVYDDDEICDGRFNELVEEGV